ncbi:hypothetical protein F2Q70_00030348 [Brassica cretica]|uniref:Uncharacterized protein n=1 Tax=Brassica cretica TaxID=69181 RepID=A0A8S9FIX3_BRACR|nr:hypothetical protein F2Q70_00030348 [Brassica cretica]
MESRFDTVSFATSTRPVWDCLFLESPCGLQCGGCRSGVHLSGCLLLAEAERRYVMGLSCYPRRLTFPQPFSYALRALVVSLLGFKLRHNLRRVSVVLVFGLQRCSVSQCRRSCPWFV